MFGINRFALALLLGLAILSGVAGAAAPPTRMDVVQAENGDCRYRWILEPGETRLVYCDLSTSGLVGNFTAVVESGSYDVQGWVSDVFTSPPGAIAVLHNNSAFRRRGNSWIRSLARP